MVCTRNATWWPLLAVAVALMPGAWSTAHAQAQHLVAQAEAEHPPAAHDASHDDHAAGHGDAHDAHAAHDDHGSIDPLVVDVDLAIWTLVVFGLLMLTLWKFAWGPISQALDKREQTIAEQIASAERVGEEARRMLAEYEAKLAAAADEVRAMLEEARRDAEHTKQQIVAEARDEATAERARALRDVETAKDQALKEIAESSARQAVDLAAKILRAQITPADHSRLIQEAMQSFPSGPSTN